VPVINIVYIIDWNFDVVSGLDNHLRLRSKMAMLEAANFTRHFCSHKSMQCIEGFMIMCYIKSFFTLITYVTFMV